jgi:flagellar motor switch protein FliM
MLSHEQISKAERIHKELGSLLEKHFTEMSEHVTDVNYSWIDQTTFGEYVKSLSSRCHSYTYDLVPMDMPATMDFALPVRNYILKLNGIERSDPLALVTDEERSVMTKYATRALADQEAAWGPVEKVRVRDATIEQNKSELSIAQTGDTILLVGYECHMQHANGIIRFAYPLSTLAPILGKLDSWTP